MWCQGQYQKPTVPPTCNIDKFLTHTRYSTKGIDNIPNIGIPSILEFLRGGEPVDGWAVVVAKPNSEQIAVFNLERQGYNCYFPRFKIKKPNQKVVIKPLFPRYLFVYISQFWYSIKGTRGVTNILVGHDGPTMVDAGIIEAIKAREGEDGFVMLGAQIREEKFKKGQELKTLEGPFAGLSLIYDSMSAHDRVKVLVDMLGRKVPIEVSEKQLLPV